MINQPITNITELRRILDAHLKQASEKAKIPLIVVMGPTASGKTGLGIALASLLNGEIVSADSRQIYRHMDIGTAKPTLEEMKQARHHLVDFMEPDEEYNLARFQREATQQLKAIFYSGKIPLLVGGTGLYISSIVQNYSLPESRPDPRLREKYERMAKEKGNEAVHEELRQKAPTIAADIHPNNLRYVIRALEVAAGNSAAKSSQTPTDSVVADRSIFSSLLLSIDWPREELYGRIEKRIDMQMEAGLLDETKKLLAKYPAGLPSLTSLGYGELGKHLRGETSREEALELFKQHTRNYAKRQLTWFRRFPQVYSIPGNQLASIIAAALNRPPVNKSKK